MKKNILWIILGVVLVLILGIGSYFIFFNRKIVSIDISKLTIKNLILDVDYEKYIR